jgi:hypothetical protein
MLKRGQARRFVKLGPREVVHAELALSDDLRDLVDTHAAGVADLPRAPGDVPAVLNGEHQSLEKRLIRLVEWAVDENALLVASPRHGWFAVRAGGQRERSVAYSTLPF